LHEVMITTDSRGKAIHRTGLIVTINACMFIFGVVLLLMGSLLPSLKVSGARAGSLGSFPLVGILIATILIGPVLDKTGARSAMGVALALIAAALAVMPSLESYAAVAVAALAYGLGGGVLNTATNALISDLSVEGRGAALNLLGFSFSLGAIIAPLLMSLAGSRFSSAAVVRVLAILPAAVLIPVLALRFPAPAHPSTPLRSLLKVLNQPLVWLFGVLLFFESGDENCMFVWAGKVTGDLLHLVPGRADLALLALSIALGAGRLLAAMWLKWIGNRNLLLLSTAVVFGGATIALTHHAFSGIIAGFAVIGFGLAAIYPTALGLAGDNFPHETGTVFGAVIAVGLVGGVAGPLAGGWTASVSPAYVLVIPLVAAVAVAILTLVVTGGRKLA
jgi:MFS transporter, FHS family, glucose/mannose:H+ symporter